MGTRGDQDRSRAGATRTFDGILFDLWGTLLPFTGESERESNIAEVARLLGADPETFTSSWLDSIEERCLGRTGSLEETVEKIAVASGGRPTPVQIRDAVAHRLRFCRDTHDRVDPILTQLDALRAREIRLAIVSDSTEETVRLWPDSRLASRFDLAVFSFNERVCKPDPQMYQRALSGLGLPSSRCAYVGDGGSRELTGAEAVGLTAYQFRFPDENRSAPRYDEDLSWRGTTLSSPADLLAYYPRRV